MAIRKMVLSVAMVAMLAETAAAQEAKIDPMTVVPDPATVETPKLDFAETPEDAGGPPDWMVAKVRADIAAAASAAGATAHEVRPRVLFSAYPADAAAEDARAQGHQLLVVATHGKGTVARALIGSVALGLLHAAPCPVLVVPHARRRGTRGRPSARGAPPRCSPR